MFSWIHMIVAALVAFVVAAITFFLLGIMYRKKVSEKEISSAEEEARRIINEAIKSAEGKKREALLEAKEEILQERSEYEKEEKQRRSDLQKSERRLQQKEESLDRKVENIERREEALNQKHADADRELEEIKVIKRSQTEMLERISGFTAEEAKNYLIAQVETEVTHETAMKIKEIEARAKEEADQQRSENTCYVHLGCILRDPAYEPLAGHPCIHPRTALRICILQDRLAETHNADALRQQYNGHDFQPHPGVRGC